MVNRINIGGFLRDLRNEKNLTQEELAEKFGVSSRSVSRWENGNTMPELGILVELADFYGVDIKEIIDGERKSEIMEKETKDTFTKVADYAKKEKQMTVRRKCVLTLVSAAVVIAIVIGFIAFLGMPLFNVQGHEITVHSVFRYETEEGYKYFVLYSTPNYSRMQLKFSAENATTLEMNVKKTLFAKTITDFPVTTDVAVYECGWTSNDNGGREFSDFDKVTFAEKEIWNKVKNQNDRVPEYVLAYENYNENSGNSVAWIVEEDYLQVLYSDGTTIKWDYDGNRMSE